MNRLIIIILIAAASCPVHAQVENIESLMTRRYLSCEDIYLNASFLIPEYYDKGSADTLNSIIDFWEDRCGNIEPIVRCRILLSIADGTFNEDIYDSAILNHLLSYRNNHRYNQSDFGHFNFNYFNERAYVNQLDDFTVKLAKELSQTKRLDEVELFFLRFYSDDYDSIFQLLETEAFGGTKIQAYYHNEITKYQKEIDWNIDYLAGIWIPQNKLKIVGSHPVVGIRVGLNYKRFIADASLGLKFIKSSNTYQVFKNDSVYNSDHFFGGYIGLDLGYEFLHINRSSFSLLGGIGYEGIDALKVDDPYSDDDITKTLNSLNLNVGLGYKIYFNDWRSLGIEVKYNYVNYRNFKGTDLSGNVITVNLIYSIIGSRINNYWLTELDAAGRR